jgi:hypothetical protein
MSRPYPEAFPLDENNLTSWQVRPLLPFQSPFTDTEHRIIAAPAASTAEAYVQRMRQLLKARFSPARNFSKIARKMEVSLEALEAAESCRLHSILEHLANDGPGLARGYDIVSSTITIPEIDVSAWRAEYVKHPRQTLNMLLQAYVAHMGTVDGEHIKELLHTIVLPAPADGRIFTDKEEAILSQRRQDLDDLITRVRHAAHTLMKRRIPSFQATRRLAKLIHACFAIPPPLPRPSDAPSERGEHMLTEAEQRAAGDLRVPGEPPEADFHADRQGWWGEMEIEDVPLTEDIAIRRAMRTQRHADAGVTIGSIERIATDQHIFKEVHLVNKGTVLIDTSGSMSLEPDQVYELATQCPAVTVAVYCGSGSGGVLRIVCHRGHIALNPRDYHPELGGNIIDGPALDWLATQESPRIWVSDGLVTGVDDRFCENLLIESVAKQLEHNIWRIPYINDVADLIKAFNDPRKRHQLMETVYA